MAFGLGKKKSGADDSGAAGGQDTNAAGDGAAATTATAWWPPSIPGLNLGSNNNAANSAAGAASGYQSYDDPTASNLREAQVLTAPPRPTPGIYRPHRPYSGFSTSLCSLFQFSPQDDSASETDTTRTDCCSMACFGILQSDRTRYLLTGVTPPSLFRRMWIHFFIPAGIFVFAGFCAVMIHDQYINSFLSTMLVLILVMYIMMDCLRGTVKRRRVREELLWRMREIDARAVGGEEAGAEAIASERMARREEHEHGAHGEDLGQTRFARTCVHRMFGCARVDWPTNDKDEPQPEDFCGKLWKFFANACCGRLCGCWLQFCGVCAMAQEAREIERLVPIGRRRIDYVTFQPYVDYFDPIKALRAARDSSLMHHWKALSSLSLILVKSLCVVVATMIVVGFVTDKRMSGDSLVLVGTFLQSFLILYFVHWKWNRFDLSLDAVIKYFACGFVLTTGLAVFFELVETVFFQLVLLLFITIFGIEEVETQDFDSTMQQQTPAFGGGGMNYNAGLNDVVGGLNLRSYSRGHGRFLQDQADDFAKTFALQYPVVVVIYLLLNAYLMAALVEELCKYFGYRMVEHPDFLTEEQMEEAAEARAAVAAAAAHHNAEDDDNGENDRNNGGGGEGDGDGDNKSETTEESGGGGGAYAPPKAAADGAAASSSTTNGLAAADPAVSGTGGPAESLVPLGEQPRSLNSRGAAITVAMVSVALGFACCENLIYIFVYNGESLGREIAVLIARSLFPIHPLAAAIQSIGVCRRDLENDKAHGVGRTILPAVILHGTFDFTLMLTSFLVGLHDMKAVEDDSFGQKAEIVSFVLSLCITVGAAAWYAKQSFAQKARLESLDRSAGGGLQEHNLV